MSEEYDVAVIGLGAMGSAASAFLAARGLKIIGFESVFPAHGGASSHGDSRLIRLGYFEDPSYVPLLHRAYENWRALEVALRTPILTMTGVLQMGTPDSQIVSGALASSRLHNLPHEVLSPDEVARRFPVFSMDRNEIAVLDLKGGYVRPEVAVMCHLKMAAENGATLHIGETITRIEPDGSGVTLHSTHAQYRARKVIVATGSWIADLVPALADHAMPIRQVVAWYHARDSQLTDPARMPAFIRDQGESGAYFGFPAIGTDGVKVGRHTHFMERIDPDKPDAHVNDADTDLIDGFMRERMPEAFGKRVNAITCRYTMLPGEDFLIDFLPGEKRVIVASPCSGHGFKFASVIGEILADLAENGSTDLPIDAFSFKALQRTITRQHTTPPS
jgi:sarcosine oxidase